MLFCNALYYLFAELPGTWASGPTERDEPDINTFDDDLAMGGNHPGMEREVSASEMVMGEVESKNAQSK